MNDVAKTNIKTRLEKALSHEVVTNQQGADFLGLNNSAYISMMKNPGQWDKCPASAWESALLWVNSGQSLREYSKKHGKVIDAVPAVEKEIAVEDKGNPADIEIAETHSFGVKLKEKEKPEIKYAVNLAEIGWVIGLHEQGKTVDQIARKLNIYTEIVKKLVPGDVVKEESVAPEEEVRGEIVRIHEKAVVDIEINILLNGERVKIS